MLCLCEGKSFTQRSDAKTPPLVPSRSPPPPGSPSEICSRHRCSSVFEQGGSGKAPVIDLSLSSDLEDLITATSHDFEFTQRLFGELNRDALGSPDNDKTIILSNFDEEEVHEEKATNIEDVAASAAVNPTSTTFADANADDAPTGQKTSIVMIMPLIIRLAATTTVEVMPASLRLPRQEGAEADVLQGELQ
jgi:hypothetical protein